MEKQVVETTDAKWNPVTGVDSNPLIKDDGQGDPFDSWQDYQTAVDDYLRLQEEYPLDYYDH